MKSGAKILEGKRLAEKIKTDLAQSIRQEKTRPGLAAVLVGDNPASLVYINLKEKACRDVGIDFHKYLCNQKCYDEISPKKLKEMIDFLNQDDAVQGIIVQLPLPAGFDSQEIISTIDPKKDVDGFHPENKNKDIVPPTIAAVLELLQSVPEDLHGKKAVLIGKESVFTAKLSDYLSDKIKPTVIDKKKSPDASCVDYDILVVSVGQVGILKPEHIKKGAIVIDVGISKVGGRVVGDVAPEVFTRAGYISPVPGGVGPLTVACLLKNLYTLFKAGG